MKTTRLPAACVLIASALALAAAPLSAAGNERTTFSAGPSTSRYETSSGDFDFAGIGGTALFHLGELLVFDASLRGSYLYETSIDSENLEHHDADVDLVISGSLVGFLTPFATLGVSCDRFDAVSYSGDTDWDAGYAIGAGVGVTIIPALWSATPAVRYVDGEHTDTTSYSLDTQVHFTLLAVGLSVTYEDNLSRDGDRTTTTAYAALRF